MRLIAAMVAAAVMSGPAWAQSYDHRWAPSGKWVVQSADNECAVGRTYASGQREITVTYLPEPASRDAALWFIGKGGSPDLDRATLSVDGDRLEQERAWPVGGTATGERVYQARLTGDELAYLRSTGVITLRDGAKVDRLPIGIPPHVQRIVKSCHLDLLKKWGFDPAVQDLPSFATPQQPRIGGYFSPGDYPDSAIRRSASGIVRVMVRVEPDGRASECKVLRSSGHKDLDDATCSVMLKRPKYNPARNSAGTTFAAPIIATIRWILPQG